MAKDSARFDQYRKYLLFKLAEEKKEAPEEAQEHNPQFDKDQLADAFAAALGRFANKSGQLKVATHGVTPYV